VFQSLLGIHNPDDLDKAWSRESAMTDDQQLSMGLPTNPQDLTTVGDYQFEPIKGYPMLNWKGKRPFTSTQYYPAQLKEVYGEAVEGWRNKIFWGDNLQVMSHLLKEFRGKINLVYIDPPFDSKADYKKRIQLRGKEVNNNLTTFEEKQYTDIWSNDEYLQFMYERLVLIRELMAENSSIYLHCDFGKVHQLRCLMDEIFGFENCLSEIIWKRSTAHSDSKQGRKAYGDITDYILLYKKSDSYTFNTQYIPYSQEYTDKYYRYVDDSGRRYWLDNIQAPGGASKGNPYYEVMGVYRHWRYSKEKMAQLISEGRVIQTAPGRVPQYKRFLDEMLGVPLQNIWDDINRINPVGNERLGYPTQKPETLLERIIKVSSNPGDVILDCFMGSGTTQAVSMKLRRRFIGADINLGAIQITTKRLLSLSQDLEKKASQISIKLNSESQEESINYYTGFESYNVNYYDVFRNPVQAKDLLIEALEINPLERGSLFDGEKDGRLWKIMPVNRITTRADLNELIAGFDYKAFEKRYQEHPHKAVEKVTLVCMGHDPDLASVLKQEVKPFELDVEVVDILRDKQEIQFKRDSEAQVIVHGSELVIETFYPMNLLAKLSLQQENVEDWRELVESVMIDWNYDGAILEPKQVDIPDKTELVRGRYSIPDDAGTIRIKITDLLSESLELEVQHG